MTTGNITVGLAPEYEDYTSLKKYIRHAQNLWSKMNLIRCTRNQAGTAGAVEIEEKAGQTIAYIGKTELTLVLASDTNDDAYDGESVTVYYLDADGVSHAASAEYNTTNTTTEVAFTDVATGLVAVTDFYCFDPAYGTDAVVSSVAVQAGDNVCIGSTGCVAGIADPETCVAIILASATSPTQANLHGVGNLWGKTEANHNDGDGMILTLDYITPWGTVVENATCTINTTDGTTEVRFLKADGETYVQDYYRTRYMSINSTPTSNTHAVFATTYNGDAIYAAIEEGNIEAVISRYMCPLGRDAWLAHFCISQAIATPLDCYMTITMTAPYGQTTTHTCVIPIPNNGIMKYDPLFRLAELSEISFTIVGNLSDNAFDFHIIEAI